MKNNNRGRQFSAAIALAWYLSAHAPLPGYGASLPEWLASANTIDIGNFGQGYAAAIIERREEFTVEATGRFVRRERGAIRILVRRSAEPYLRVVGFENSDQTVKEIKTWTIGRDGRVVESEKKDVVTQSEFADFALFSDDRFKYIQAPGVEDGSLLGYEITTEGRNHLQSERIRLEEKIPVWLCEVQISVPSGSLRWFVNFADRVEVINQTPSSVTFRSLKRPAVPEEDHMPPYWSVAASVFVNYDPKGNSAVQSWQEAGRTIYPFFSDARKITPEIGSELNQLLLGKTGLLDKLETITRFVSQQVRYVAVEIGKGAFQPHPAADVYRYKYGDCKDKAILLLTMLDQIGLLSYPALLGTRTSVEANPDLPTLTTFNHLIVALPIPPELQDAVEPFPAYDPQSRILWVDPTSETHPLGELPEMDQGVYALVSYGDRGELYPTPESSPAKNGETFEATLHLDSSGKGTAEVRIKYQGNENASRRAFYRSQSQSELRRIFERRVSSYASGAVLLQASISGLDHFPETLTEEISFTGDFATGFSGQSWLFQPLFLSGTSGREVGGKPRVHPLDWGAPQQRKGIYRILLPDGLQIARPPERVSIQSEFGALQIQYELNGNSLVATYEETYTLSRIPPEKYADFREFVNQVLRLGRQRVRVSPP